MNGKTINVHVKGTNPFTKDLVQIEAFGHLTQAMLAKPVMNKSSERLELIDFNGYIPVGIKKDYWVTIWNGIAAQPTTSLDTMVTGSDKELDSKLHLGFSWEQERNGLKGRIGGINAFQNTIHRINDIDASIPQSSQDIEVAILVNLEAKQLKLNEHFLSMRRLDGIMMITANPGSLGYYFERSEIHFKPEFKHLASILEKTLPEVVWLC